MRFVLFALFLLCLFSSEAQTQKIYFIKAGKFYDSEKNIFLPSQNIIVEGKKIKAVGTNLKVPAGAEILDLSKSTVSPGLIDAHTHIFTIQKSNDPLEVGLLMNSDIERSLRAVKIARSYLDAGFTTIRDLGNSGMFLDLNIKRSIAKGWVIGPRMIISGPIMAPEDGQFFELSQQNRPVIDREYRVIKNIEDARQAVKDHISHGVDVIKVVMGDGRLTLPIEEVKSIVETAHSYGVKVTAHATYDKVIAVALDAGVDGIEHGYGISDSLLDVMAKKKVYLVPTIGTFESYRSLLDPEHKKSDDEMKGMKDWVAASETIVKKAIDKGVMIVNGADMYIATTRTQGDEAKSSMLAYYEGSKKANDVFKTATWNAAIACGVNRFTGVIKQDMTADIVAFDGDIENDFANALYKVQMVMKDGEILLKK